MLCLPSSIRRLPVPRPFIFSSFCLGNLSQRLLPVSCDRACCRCRDFKAWTVPIVCPSSSSVATRRLAFLHLASPTRPKAILAHLDRRVYCHWETKLRGRDSGSCMIRSLLLEDQGLWRPCALQPSFSSAASLGWVLLACFHPSGEVSSSNRVLRSRLGEGTSSPGGAGYPLIANPRHVLSTSFWPCCGTGFVISLLHAGVRDVKTVTSGADGDHPPPLMPVRPLSVHVARCSFLTPTEIGLLQS